MVENEEISSFLDGQEIVFTTGIGINSDKELLSLIKHNIKNGASGMVINKGPYIKKITDEMINYCNKMEFPLFIVPWEEKMARIMRIFSFYILEEEKKKIELNSAVKNAIFSPIQEDLFIPILERCGFNSIGKYKIALFKVTDKHLLLKIKKEMEYILENRDREVAFTIIDNFIVLLLSDFTNEVIKQVNTQIDDMLALKFEAIDYLLSVGSEVNQIKEIKKSYNQAVFVQKVLKSREESKKFGCYESIGAYQLLSELKHTEEIKSYISNNIEVLYNYDKVKSTNYTKVLRLYIESNGSVIEVANKLYLHRNTINYRISRIEEIMNCDLNLFSTRLNIALAFMVTDIFE